MNTFGYRYCRLGLPDEDGLSLIRRWRSGDVSLPVLGVNRAERLAEGIKSGFSPAPGR